MITIAFLGSGNMASAIIQGLLDNKKWANDTNYKLQLNVADKKALALDQWQKYKQINTTGDNKVAIKNCQIIFLAVKPNQVKEICKEISRNLAQGTLIISIAAGITTDSIAKWLSPNKVNIPIIRLMPNTPALIKKGVTGMFANAKVSESQKETCQELMEAVSYTFWVENENTLDSVTAISGSGPAYLFYLLKQMTTTGIKIGLDAATSRKIAALTLAGAAEIANSSQLEINELISNVCSPNGTTEQAIKTLDMLKVDEGLQQAVFACYKRALEITKNLNET